MDHLILIGALILAFVGILGSVVPGPGPWLGLIGMFLIQWRLGSYSPTTLWILSGLNVVMLLVDYLLPIWFAKKYGASKYGIWGSMIGMVLGLFFTPIGMMLGLFLGAVIGELIAGKQEGSALKAGWGTFLGTIAGMGLKLGLAGFTLWFVLKAMIEYYF